MSPLARKSVVGYLVKRGGCSERQACFLVSISRSVVRYPAKKPGEELELMSKIHELAVRHGRYGYRRVTALLKRAGWKVNHKRVHRI